MLVQMRCSRSLSTPMMAMACVLTVVPVTQDLPALGTEDRRDERAP